MYYELIVNVNSKLCGVGNRRLLNILRISEDKEDNIDKIVDDIVNDMNNDEIKLRGVTIVCHDGIFINAEQLLPLFTRLKKSKVDIWIYSPVRMDDLLGYERTPAVTELLKCIHVMIDGFYIDNDDSGNPFLKYRNRTSERIIDVKKTINRNDGKVYLLSYVHLQEPYQNRFSFANWLKYNLVHCHIKTIDCIKYITKFDPNIIISNDIDDMVCHLKDAGCSTLMINTFRYIHNRWCSGIKLYEPMGRPNSFTLHFHGKEHVTITANKLLLEYNQLKKEKRLIKPSKINNTKQVMRGVR